MCDLNDIIYDDEIDMLKRQTFKERQLRSLRLHNLDAPEDYYDEDDKSPALCRNTRRSTEC